MTKGTVRPGSRVKTSRAIGVSDVVLLAVTLNQDAVQAYVDPGTGSYLFQLGVAGLLAGLYTVKRYWRAIRDAFRNSPWRRKREVESSGRHGVE